jgi:hypothetical protein
VVKVSDDDDAETFDHEEGSGGGLDVDQLNSTSPTLYESLLARVAYRQQMHE